MKCKNGDKVRVKSKTVFKDDISFHFKGFESYIVQVGIDYYWIEGGHFIKFKDDDLEKIDEGTSYTLTDKASKLTEVPEHYQIEGLSQSSMEIIDTLVKHNTSDVKEACYLFMILKYLFRFGKKDGVKDLYKAKDFLDRLIEVQNERN